jgi:hypothetical protein
MITYGVLPSQSFFPETVMDRRAFLESGLVLPASLGMTNGVAPPITSAAFEPAELVVVNARVYTVDDARPRAEAFAVQNGRFSAVGSNAEIRALAGRNTRVIDAAGMTVVPGFIDTHSHPSGVQELTGVNVNLRTVAEVKEALRKKAATTQPGYWVSGYMYDDTKLDRPGRLIRRWLVIAAGTRASTTASPLRMRTSP